MPALRAPARAAAGAALLPLAVALGDLAVSQPAGPTIPTLQPVLLPPQPVVLPPAPPQAMPPQPIVLTPAPPYQCGVLYDQWRTAWTPQWQAWCCEHEGRACPTTTTSTETSTTKTSTTRTTTSVTSTTATSTETSTRTSTSTGTTTTTLAPTTTEAPASTAEAQAASSATTGTPAVIFEEQRQAEPQSQETAPTLAPPRLVDAAAAGAEDEEEGSCESKCDYGAGPSYTCRQRVEWATTHESANEASPCEAAFVLVQFQCSTCGGCRRDSACPAAAAAVSSTPNPGHLWFAKKFLAPPHAQQHAAQSAVARVGGGRGQAAFTGLALLGVVAGVALLKSLHTRDAQRRATGVREALVYTSAPSVDQRAVDEDMWCE